MHKDRIAIIGIGCRFPGGVDDAESFWKLLIERRDAVSEVPADRWSVERYYDREPAIPGKTFVKRGGFLDQIDKFDPQFFGISPREAPYVDPQHRLLLETSWEAIEDAGVVLDFEKGSDVAVFVGISHNDYQGIQSSPSDHFGISAHTPTGSAHSIAANRISYCLNLRGPSVAMDTACSSALTAVHSGCEHIWAGRGDAALALAVAPSRNRSADAPLPIGSINTNLGNLETAAGVAGLLKAMLVLKHGQIPPSLHFSTPNPHIDFEKLKLRVPTQLEPFPNGTAERIAGVNSFGFGGANAHVILAEPPPHQPEKSLAVPGCRPWPVMLSARSEASLRTSAANLSAWIKEHANANGSSPVLPDLTYTLGARRNHHPHRLTLVADS